MKNIILYLAVIACMASCNSLQKANARAPKRPAKTSVKAPVKEWNLDEYREKEVGTVDAVILEAKSYTGTPYRYGGTSRSGVDCSGLMCLSFKEVGITLPRNSAAQSKVGTPVRIAELQPGDLLFFSMNKGSGSINHVGLVTEVRGRESVRFIHSTSSLGVMEDDLFSNYYKKTFVKAVRPKYD